jgi:hypothetical protein
MPKAGSEAAAIEEAYAEQVKHLFTVLIKNLEDESGNEQQVVDRFKAGLDISKRAKQLALSAASTEGGPKVAKR